jgi:AhpD family alkylhydroperoxidase
MTMKTIQMTMTKMLVAAVAMAALASTARAEGTAAAAAKADIQKTFGFAPQFLLKLPEEMLPGVWEELKTLQLNPATALSGRTKELIGLGVAAQIPCRYCITAHTEFAKLNGASDKEIGEAVAMAAITRHWSTFLNGIQTDETSFHAEINKLVDNAKKSMMAAAQKGSVAGSANGHVVVTDGASALREVTQMFGFAPEFLKRFPEEARAGAWKQMRDVQMSSSTALSGKSKELVGLAVASQVPCRFCIIAHTEFAKLNGATDAEISEAIAMASLTRSMSTLLNGLQMDETQFRHDVDRLVKGAKAAAAKPTAQR